MSLLKKMFQVAFAVYAFIFLMCIGFIVLVNILYYSLR